MYFGSNFSSFGHCFTITVEGEWLRAVIFLLQKYFYDPIQSNDEIIRNSISSRQGIPKIISRESNWISLTSSEELVTEPIGLITIKVGNLAPKYQISSIKLFPKKHTYCCTLSHQPGLWVFTWSATSIRIKSWRLILYNFVTCFKYLSS